MANQSMAKMLNRYFSSVFNTTLFGDGININDTNTNEENSSASVVGREDTTTEHCNNNTGIMYSVRNINENPYVLGHFLQLYTAKFLYNIENDLDAINNVKTNKSPGSDNACLKILLEKQIKQIVEKA